LDKKQRLIDDPDNRVEYDAKKYEISQKIEALEESKKTSYTQLDYTMDTSVNKKRDSWSGYSVSGYDPEDALPTTWRFSFDALGKKFP